MTMTDLRKLIDRYAPPVDAPPARVGMPPDNHELSRLCVALVNADQKVRELGKRLDELRNPKDTRRFAP